MNISDLISIVEKYGIKGTTVIILVFLIISIVKSDWFSRFLSKISDKFIESFMRKRNIENPIREINESDISNHDIFNYIDFWMYSKVPTLILSTEYRTLVFRKYLTLYLKSYKRNISAFVESRQYQEMSDDKLLANLLNLINIIIYDYESEALISGIPKIVIEKMKFKNNETIILTLDLIKGTCSSNFYTSESNLLKVYSVLNIILSILENTIAQSENVCNSINGQLKGSTFDGKVEP